MTRPKRVPLPALTDAEAVFVFDLCDALIDELWKVHGDALADYCAWRVFDRPDPSNVTDYEDDDIPF